MRTIKQVAIIGLGMMGGSLALALRQGKNGPRVVGYARRTETRKAALAAGMVEMVYDRPENAVKGADLVVFCLPVLAISPLLQSCLPFFDKGCVVTDVGSTKRELCLEAGRFFAGRAVNFVGSHPMAGSEKTGLAAARADLYRGAVVILTPVPAPGSEASNCALDTVRAFWESVGARCVVMDAETHDRLVSRTSHLPHLVAATLVNCVLAERDAMVRLLCGSGFRDTTRIAAGSEEMWHDVLRTNSEPILAALDAFIRTLQTVHAKLAAGDFEGLKEFLRGARHLREEVNRA